MTSDSIEQPGDHRDYLFVVIQAGDKQPVHIQWPLTYEGYQDDMPSYIWRRLDRQLLEECGYVDRQRMRLTYRTPWGAVPYSTGMLAFPTHSYDQSIVHILDGPAVGREDLKVSYRTKYLAVPYGWSGDTGSMIAHYDLHGYRELVLATLNHVEVR